MKITIQNGELEQKVGIALKGVNGRNSTKPILKCIIIKAKEDEILLEATNLEIGLRVKVDGTVEEEGCCAIDGKSLADISRKMPEGDVVIQSDEKTAVISGKKVKIKLPVSDVESFPGLPDLTEMEVSCSVLQGALKDVLNGVLFSIAVTEVNQMLSVVHVKCEEGQMRLIGLDGHRIAIRALEVQTEEMELNLPGIPLKEIAKLLNSEEQKVDLCVTEHLASIKEKYEYVGKTFSIVVPEKIEQIIEEGQALKHCLDRSDRYFERIANQESYIVFLRRTKAMEQPYYTLEIEPDGTTRQKRTVGDNQNNDYHRAEKFLKKWQAAIRPRLSQEDFERQEISRQLRMYELESLRNDKVTVHGGIHAGELLADILEADLMEA